MSQGPLSGVTILDMTRALAGPVATLILSGLGARVIRIEQPEVGEGRTSAPFIGSEGVSLKKRDGDVSLGHVIRHRGKDSITLNLKHPKAKEIFKDLVQQVDIVVENFSPGTSDRLGVGYKDARAVKPSIVYTSITGYGHAGGSPGKVMDAVAQALAGTMMVSGLPEDPPVRHGMPFADLVTPLFAVIGTLAALRHRDQTGEGQHVDVSMLGVMTSLQAMEPWKILEDLGVPTRTGNTVPRLSPFGIYKAQDAYVALCPAVHDRTRINFFTAIGRPELAEDERFNNQPGRLLHHKELEDVVSDWIKDLPADEAVERLIAHGAMAARVRTPDEANKDVRVLRRGEVVPVEHPVVGAVNDNEGNGINAAGLPIVFSQTPAKYARTSDELGGHNEDVFQGILGYSKEHLEELANEGVI